MQEEKGLCLLVEVGSLGRLQEHVRLQPGQLLLVEVGISRFRPLLCSRLLQCATGSSFPQKLPSLVSFTARIPRTDTSLLKALRDRLLASSVGVPPQRLPYHSTSQSHASPTRSGFQPRGGYYVILLLYLVFLYSFKSSL